MKHSYLLIPLIITACAQPPKDNNITVPWGNIVTQENKQDSVECLSINDIISQGELIAFTLSGPDTYYEYHGRGMGIHYLLAEKYAQNLGVKLRIELCNDSTEMIRKLANMDGDLIIVPEATCQENSLIYHCGPQWLTNNKDIATNIKQWYKGSMMAETEKLQRELLANRYVKRHIYQPMLDNKNGVISRWDSLFRQYAQTARMDWRLVAAQCYQESCFDPHAHSWAGACGLMQIMPATARQLGLPLSDIYSPEHNISAAMSYMKMLQAEFRDIPRNRDRICFALAAYNGGKHHIRDAMALTRKYGKDPYKWDEVQEFVLKLSQAQFYTDPIVKYGYMRGAETTDYVNSIMQRYAGYKGKAHASSLEIAPQRATKQHKYKPQA